MIHQSGNGISLCTIVGTIAVEHVRPIVGGILEVGRLYTVSGVGVSVRPYTMAWVIIIFHDLCHCSGHATCHSATWT